MKGRWLVGAVACAVILAVAGVAGAVAVKTSSDAMDTSQKGTAWLGVQLQDLTRDVARSMDLKTYRGALIAQVQDGSPADQAGLKARDVITRFNGKTIRNGSDLTDQVRREEPGREVPVTVIRNGGEMKLTVRLGDISERDRYGTEGTDTYGDQPNSENEPEEQGEPEQGMGNQPMMMGNMPMRGMREPTAFLGVQLQTLTEQLGDYFGVQDGRGALIARVVEDSPAAKAGLKAGDVITKVDDQDITNPNDVTRLVYGDSPGERINITYVSNQGHSENTVSVRLAKPPAGENMGMMDREMGPMQGMQGMQDWQMRNRMQGTYGSAGPGYEMREQMHQQMQELRGQMEQLRQQIESLRQQLQEQQEQK